MSTSSSATIGFISLGCPKNLVDSERILTELRTQGYRIVPNYDNADLVIVNTCGFIDSAVEESLEAIEEALNENGKVIVTGCLGAREDRIRTIYPNVLEISGPHSYEQVVSHVNRYLPAPPHDPFSSLTPMRQTQLTPRHYAYLKISEGCDHHCTFCIIPELRGKLESRPIGSILSEAKRLVDTGVKELIIIAQDTAAYGVDLKQKMDFWEGQPAKSNLISLCEQLAKLNVWVRLHYVYPYPDVDRLIPKMAEGSILPYLDIPLQHASASILKSMKRPGSREKMLERIKQWRKVCPDLAIRSTFIVGYPGETAADFQQLLDFLAQAKLDHVGCFKYSPVDGAVANTLPNPIPEEIKEARYHQLMQLQQAISIERRKAQIGKVLSVIIDEVNAQGAIGRTFYDAPEIDGVVYIRDAVAVRSGEIIKVMVERSDEYDLYGSLIN